MGKDAPIERRDGYNRCVQLPDSDPQGWAMKALREAGNSFLTEIYGLDDETLTWRPAEDEPSIKEIAAHVRDASELALAQITHLLFRGRGKLPAQDIDVLLMERDYRTCDLDDVLDEFRDNRRELVSLLWSLTSSDWDATASHPYRGEISAATIAGELARHDLEHLWHVRKIKATLPAKIRNGEE